MREKTSQVRRYANLFRHLSNPGCYLRLKLGLAAADPLEFRLRQGLRVQVPIQQLNEFKCILMDDCYFKAFRPGFLGVPGAATILDVGANLGFFSLYALSRFPGSRVVSVEPVEQNYAWLVRNLEANPAARFQARRVALSDHRGSLRIVSRRAEAFPTGASMLNAVQGGAGEVAYEVPTLPLAELLAEERLERVDFLKCDCEGAEYAIFYPCPGACLARISHLAMEVHPGPEPDQNVDAMRRFLAGHGFACCVSTDRHFLWASRDPAHLRER